MCEESGGDGGAARPPGVHVPGVEQVVPKLLWISERWHLHHPFPLCRGDAEAQR